MNIQASYNKSMNRSRKLANSIRAKATPQIVNTTNSISKQFNKMDVNRNKILTKQKNILANNINTPISPVTCSGTSFKCNVAGSGKTKITNVSMFPSTYDFQGTPIQEGGLTGNTHQLPIVHNWKNSTIETKYTKDSLRNSIGFENFQ
mgnify:CR=1 FL=1